MTGLIKKMVLSTALAASTLAATAPAQAQYYGGYRHHGHGDAAGAAILGGILGLGVGAAIASSNNRGRYYDRGYAYDRGYYDAPPPRAYYDDYRSSYQPRCYYERQYDRWSGRPYDVRVCR